MRPAIYSARRDALRAALGQDHALFPGSARAPRNYRDNVYPFRQDSHFLYLARLERPGLALLVGPDGDRLFGPPEDLDDVVWHGPHASLAEAAGEAGIARVEDLAGLPAALAEIRGGDGRVHWLPPYRGDTLLMLARTLGEPVETVRREASEHLASAMCDLRLMKGEDEIAEIEDALEVTAAMHREAMRMARPGVLESEIAAEIQRIALARGRAQAYQPIVSVRGEVLHNEGHDNRLEAGQLLLNDSGAESPLGYASDITRTTPVGGRFEARQKAIYEVVLAAQEAAIAACVPGAVYRDVHLLACRRIVEGLSAVGLMKGDPAAAVEAGAHALFFPHGLGHMLGLDVHDMEDLGDVVGYGREGRRSEQFGLAFLRMGRTLEAGHVITVEPGIYFIPALIERWGAEKRHADFIVHDRLAAWTGFGGIRIEDDVLVAESGPRILGPAIPKAVDEVEAIAAS